MELGIAGTVHLVLFGLSVQLSSGLLIALSVLFALILFAFLKTKNKGEKAMTRDLLNPSKVCGALIVGLIASLPGLVPPL